MVCVKVPGTSANMGPGFDALGVALKIYNVYEAEEIEEGVKFEGFLEEFSNEDNIIYKAMIETFNFAKYKHKGIFIKLIEQNIPIARGLGSSSSCIVAGIVLANGIIGNTLSKSDMLSIAVKIEGHPDNVAPALLGGIVVSVCDDKTYYERVLNKNDLKFVAIIPDFKLSTEESREVLPKELSYKDAVYNLSRVALLVLAFNNGNNELLKIACKDSMHENYRGKLIKRFDLIKKEAYNNGALACYLSGAGPTIMAIVQANNNFVSNMQNVIEKENLPWKIEYLDVDYQGAIII